MSTRTPLADPHPSTPPAVSPGSATNDGGDGLTDREAARRLVQYGANEIVRREQHGHARDVLAQLSHPLALLLWVAAGLAVVGGIPALAVAIVVVIILNAAFAFAQELQAEHATEALAGLLPPQARVRRSGRTLEVAAGALVPGDRLLIEEGDRLSADVRIDLGEVDVDMAALTGESQPVSRSADPGAAVAEPLQARNLLFSGTLCIAGRAEGVVQATGMSTQLGRIAALSQRVHAEISPLQAEVNRAAWLIAGVAVAAGALFLLIGTTIAGLPVGDALTFAIGLLVANVPEGLLPIITLALAVGVRRMARRRALVKRLTAVETLGCTDVICTDKTGTLTEGRMAVRRLWCDGRDVDLAAPPRSAAQDQPLGVLIRTAVRCNNATIVRGTNDAWLRHGDPGESALLLAAALLGEDVERLVAERDDVRNTAFHFDPALKRMTTLDREDDGLWLHSKGAPLELLDRCVAIRGPHGERPLDDVEHDRIADAFETYARRGLRVLGFAARRVRDGEDLQDRTRAEAGLVFLGLAALEDPPRPDVAAAVRRCHAAGIRLIVVTGDHALTAEAIAREVGIVDTPPTVLTGPDVDAMGEERLEDILAQGGPVIIARSSPETKLHVVDALRALGHVVAMTGDGVNDAPALRRADIGVAMGASGTDVAREAATMVLTDDNFASIVAAVEEGRVVYDNIRKFVTYIFAHATPEVVPFLLFALSGGTVPLPLTALQILAIDLGTETLPALALGREPAEPGIMGRAPRPRGGRLLDRPMLTRAWLWLGLVEAALVTAGFLLVLHEAGWAPGDATNTGSPLHDAYLMATTMTFAGIAACQIGTAFAARTSRASLRSVGLLSNPLLLWGIAFEGAFTAAVIYLPPLQSLFGTAALQPHHLLVLGTFPIVVWGTDELRRWWVRHRTAEDPKALP